MELFKHSIVLSKRYERYAGDNQYTLGLLVDYKGVAYLYHSSDNEMKAITSYAPYVHWLIHNSMDLLSLSAPTEFNNKFFDWWSQEGDRNDYTQRREEFKSILNSF